MILLFSLFLSMVSLSMDCSLNAEELVSVFILRDDNILVIPAEASPDTRVDTTSAEGEGCETGV